MDIDKCRLCKQVCPIVLDGLCRVCENIEFGGTKK